MENKAKRVASYAARVNAGINTITHSCDLIDAREFRREHARMVLTAGKSERLDSLYPYPGTDAVKSNVESRRTL